MLRYARSDWPDQVSQSIRPYWLTREEIAIEGDCILCGTQIIVPKKLQQNVLEELHMQRSPWSYSRKSDGLLSCVVARAGSGH